MKVRNEKRKRAINIFTDREEPREAFWNNYRQFKKNMQNGENDIRVLCYYGIGGIGKSSLLKKIKAEVKCKVKSPVIIHDFSIETDSRAVLYRLRNQLTDKYKYDFPLFDYGYYCFARKNGEDKNEPEIKGFVERSSCLSGLLDALGQIPEFDIIPSLIKITDKVITYKIAKIKNALQKNQEKIEKIEEMESKELTIYLTNLFTTDLKNNLNNKSEPLVIMFDTYEALVDEMGKGESLKNDEWIRGQEGLIQNTPNVLWVIAGREKLKWELFNHEWKDALETHLLGDLSKTDAIDFLETSGIKNMDLCNRLYELTHGTPVYLDLCIDQYFQITEKGKEATVDDFGRDNYGLVSRFTSYMDIYVQDIVYFLCCLKKWNNEMLMAITNQVLPSFSPTAYNKVKQFSFITATDNSFNTDDVFYSIHNTIGDVLYQYCPIELKNKAIENASVFCKNKLKTLSITSPSYIFYVQQLMNYALDYYEDEDKIYAFFMENIYYCLKNLINTGQITETYTALMPLQKKAIDLNSILLTAAVLKCKGQALIISGSINEATKCLNKALQNIIQYYGSEDPYVLIYKLDYAQCLLAGGKFLEAYDIAKYVLEIQKPDLCDKGNQLIADFMSVKANALVELGIYDEARTQLEKILKQQIDKKGRKTYEVVYAMGNLANVLEKVGKYREAQILHEERLNTLKSLKNFGANHPYTLATTIDLAGTNRNLGQLEFALKLIEDVLSKERFVGKKHIIIIKALMNKIAILLCLEKFDEARNLIDNILPIIKERLGKKHPETLKFKEMLAILLLSAGKYTEAIELLKENLVEEQDLFSGNCMHPNIVDTLNNLAFVYHKTEEIEKGIPYVQQLKKIINERKIDNELNFIIYKHTLAWYYIDTENFELAEKLTKELVNEIESHYPENKLWLHNIYFVAAICLERQNKINALYLEYSEKLYGLIENKNSDNAKVIRKRLDEIKYANT